MEETYVVRNNKGQELFATEWGTDWVEPGKGTRMQKGRADAEAQRHGGTSAMAEGTVRMKFVVLSEQGELQVKDGRARWVEFGRGSRFNRDRAQRIAESCGGTRKGIGAYLAG
jgi:hypothetical protein